MSLELATTTAYFRGKFVPFHAATLSIASAPLLYGLSVYTVVPVFWNDSAQTMLAFRLPDHFKRLQNSAQIMDFHEFTTTWNYSRFEQTVIDLVRKNQLREDVLVRASVYVDELLSGTKMHGLKHDLSIFVYPQPTILPASGAHLGVSSWVRTADNAIPSRAKINGSYANVALMKNEAVLNGFDDAIALDDHGHVSESTVTNLFLVRDGVLLTPHAGTDILEGITRDSVMKLAEQLGVSSEERSIDRSELYIADEVFLCGSSARITPVLSIDHRQIGDGRPGKLTMQLRERYQAVARGSIAEFAAWRTPLAVEA